MPTPPTAPRTGLWGLGFRFEIIALKFLNIYEDIRDIWLLGKWLAAPFYYLNWYFTIARDKTWQADTELVKALTWIRGLIEGTTIADVLENIWFEFTYLRRDPVGWVSAKIDQVSDELRYVRLDPFGWIRTRLYMAFSGSYNLFNNSAWWIYVKLNERYPDIGSFIRDSWGYIRSRVLGLFFWARELDVNPGKAITDWLTYRTGWFRSFVNDPWQFIIDRLKEYSYDLNLFLTDSRQWLKQKMASILGISVSDMDNFVVALIKTMFNYVLYNYQGLLDYVQQATIEIILRFI